MAGIVGLTELQHTNATSAMTIDASGNLTIKTGTTTVKGEGSNTTNLQQGLLKYWNAFNGAGGSSYDSFNNASVTDHGTNDHTFTFTTAFSSVNYTVTFGGGNNDASGGSFFHMICDHHLSTYLRCYGGYSDGTANHGYEWSRNHLQVAGDLA